MSALLMSLMAFCLLPSIGEPSPLLSTGFGRAGCAVSSSTGGKALLLDLDILVIELDAVDAMPELDLLAFCGSEGCL
jgi:hypothetical protein